MSNPRIARKSGQPANSKQHSDLYTDENPKGTIQGLGFKDVEIAKQSVTKIKNSGRSHAHKIQAAIAMEQRAREMGKSSEAAVFRKYINIMKEKTKEMNEEGLGDWFLSKSVGPKPKRGWVDVVDGDACAREDGETATPKCVSSETRASMSKAERLAAQSAKRREDPNQPQKSNASKPTMVKTDRKVTKEEMNLQEIKDKPGKGSGTKDDCYYKVKSRYSVWPSAYASGALVKCRKVGAANWGNKTESYPTIAERILGEEKCGKGMYWCNTDEVCKPIPKGFKTPGQKTEPTEVGIGKPVESGEKCNHTKKGKSCPVHNKEECPMSEAKEKDHEYSMARSELSTIANATKRLQKKMRGEGNIEAWVQSKITKAADYLDSAADYVDSGEMDEGLSFEVNPKDIKKSKRSSAIRNLSLRGSTEGEIEAAEQKRKEPRIPLVRRGDESIRNINAEFEQTLVDKLTNEILDEKCWAGYKKKGMKTMFGKRYPNCVKVENVTIEDAEGNTFAEVVDLIKPEPIKGFKSQIEEVTRLQAQTGNVIAITLSWRAKYYSLKMFFPQVKLPTRKEINNELQKVYPGCNVIHHTVSEIQPGQPLIQAFGPQGGSSAKFGANKNYIKTMGEEVEIDEEGPSLSVGRGEKLSVSQGGGLTAKGREKYNRATGSNLQAPVTGDVEPGSKAAIRRKNFCSRSIRWKGERGLAARRRWKC